MPSSLGFGAVFVISKAGDHPRKQTIHRALEQLGISHAFFDATMGADLSPAEVAAVYDEQGALTHKTISRRLHPTMIGCSLSHRRLYAEVEHRGLPSALVLEDDAQPIEGRLGMLPACLAELPPGWDLLYLGLRGHRLPPAIHGFKVNVLLPFLRLLKPGKYRLTRAEAARLYLRPFSAHLYRAGYHQGTHAYAVSRKGAAILHAHGLPITAPPDAYLATLIVEGKLNAFAVREDLFTTTGAPSQITGSL